MEQSNLSLYTSLCKYTKLLGDGPKGPEHVADLLLTARGSLQKCCVDAWSRVIYLCTSLFVSKRSCLTVAQKGRNM